MKTKTVMAFELAVAARGKRKELATKTIIYLDRLLAEELAGHPDLLKAKATIASYRKALDE